MTVSSSFPIEFNSYFSSIRDCPIPKPPDGPSGFWRALAFFDPSTKTILDRRLSAATDLEVLCERELVAHEMHSRFIRDRSRYRFFRLALDSMSSIVDPLSKLIPDMSSSPNLDPVKQTDLLDEHSKLTLVSAPTESDQSRKIDVNDVDQHSEGLPWIML